MTGSGSSSLGKPECQEVPVSHPKGKQLRRAEAANFDPAQGCTNLHGGGMSCTQAGGRRALS